MVNLLFLNLVYINQNAIRRMIDQFVYLLPAAAFSVGIDERDESSALPNSHPAVVDAVIMAIPETTTPASIEMSTIARERMPGSSGSPKNMPATFMPAAPPSRLPGSSPKTAKSTSPAPAPM
jgi:hypothetical protein